MVIRSVVGKDVVRTMLAGMLLAWSAVDDSNASETVHQYIDCNESRMLVSFATLENDAENEVCSRWDTCYETGLDGQCTRYWASQHRYERVEGAYINVHYSWTKGNAYVGNSLWNTKKWLKKQYNKVGKNASDWGKKAKIEIKGRKFTLQRFKMDDLQCVGFEHRGIKFSKGYRDALYGYVCGWRQYLEDNSYAEKLISQIDIGE